MNIIEYLKDKDINISYEGEKNVSKGWIGIQCIFPDCDDQSNHLGIYLYGDYFKCWVCGKGGSYVKLIKEIEQCTWSEAYAIERDYEDFGYEYLKKEFNEIKKESELKEIILPKNFIPLKENTGNWDHKIHYFIASRGFDIEYTINKYNLFYSGHLGIDAFRLIIPIYINNMMVAYVGRDISGLNNKKYKNSSNEKSVIPVGKCLYEIDKIKNNDKIILVEGPLDQWKLGDGAVATFGITYTKEQIQLLREKNPSKIIILFDSEKKAQEQAIKLANDIWFCPTEIQTVNLVKDPGELSIKAGRYIKYKLLEK